MCKMFTRLTCIIIMITVTTSMVFAQSATISGTITDKTSSEPLAGVAVTVKGKSQGVSTNENGKFTLTVSEKLPFTIVITYIGYKKVEQSVTGSTSNFSVALESESILGQEVVVAASRTPERILESPVSIERVGAAAIRETAAPSFYDALTNLKGVEASAQSLTFKSINTRGFNANGNTRFNQYIDGMDNQAPGLNFSVGNIVGISELDVESAELLPGASSALYGAGGTNGTLLLNSKNPFTNQGLSANYKAGMNHEDGYQRSRALFQDMSIRYAKAWNNKFAFKTNFSYLEAKDWQAQDYSNYDRLNNVPKGGDRVSDPNFDGVNIYGDEINANMRTVAQAVQDRTRADILAAAGVDIVTQLNTLPANASQAQIGGFIGNFPAALQPTVQNLIPFYFGLRNNIIPNQSVSRTGYAENDLVDYNTRSFKTSSSLNYKITDNIEAIAQGNWGTGTSVYTGSDRYSLRNFSIGQYKLELKGSNFFLRAYTTQEKSGDAYNATALGSLLNEKAKVSTAWFPEYVGNYVGAALTGASPSQAHLAARAKADGASANGTAHLLPGTEQYNAAKDEITSKTIGPGEGAKFNDKSNLYHYEGMYNFSAIKVVDLLVGASYRTYALNSGGTIFDDAANAISINEFGSYAQIAKKLLNDKIKLTGSVRYDKNENFKGQFTPRISGVFTVAPNNNVRISYQTGFRNPTTQNQFIDLKVRAQTKLIGGLPQILDKYNLNTNKGYTLQSFQQFAASGNPALLKEYTFAEFKPESVQAYEIGYKGLVTPDLLVDAFYYFNSYKDFISTLVLVQNPTPGNPAGLAAPNIFSTVVNSTSKVETNGWGLGLDYRLSGWNLTGNVSYNKLAKKRDDGLVNEYNTPEYRFNIGLGRKELVKNVGFNLNYRWQDAFLWESTFAAGPVPAFGTVDGQINVRIPEYKTTLKLGGSDLFNKYYRTSFGNPQMGAMYYVSLTFDQFLK